MHAKNCMRHKCNRKLMGKKGKKISCPPVCQKKKILDDQKSPTPPPPPSRVKWSAPKVNQHATIHLYTRYLACLHQTLCLSPALLLQMDLKLHLKMTKIYTILAVQACKQAGLFCRANNNNNVLQPPWTVGGSQKVIPGERLTGFSFFLLTTSACLPLLSQFSNCFQDGGCNHCTSQLSLKKYLLCRLQLYNCLDEISAILIKPLKVQLWKAFEQSKCDGSSCKKVWQDLHIDFALTEIWEKEIDGRVMLFMVTGAGNMLLCY